ncbi:glycoside hydrolase family 88 protein [Tricladium varicosporioides]|nr:glycoside hydrolase family 88 protein [Hymenoscyphus varicosporioides]
MSSAFNEDKIMLSNEVGNESSKTYIPTRLDLELEELFAENVVAKIWSVAVNLLKNQNNVLTHYPESVPQTGLHAGQYELREAEFWTCGFFPGSLYAILERSMKYPQYFKIPHSNRLEFSKEILELARTWAEPLYAMATRTDTHDMGFIIQPALRMDWELTGNVKSLESVLVAARSLASRYDERVNAIRSWDQAINKRYRYTDKDVDFLVIIDSMCNLDLLYYAGHHTSDQKLIDIATTHAHTVLKTIVRDDFSTFHLVNFDPKTGEVKNKLTNQGYRDWSTWSRGQAWAILGFTQTFIWTKDPVFLQASISLANYFLSRMDSSTHLYPYVPLWDFDAPVPLAEGELPLRDTSAGMIAANGLLLLFQTLQGEEAGARFFSAAIRIVRETVELSLSKSKASFKSPTDHTENVGAIVMSGEPFDAILRNATANRNDDSLRQYWDHGLVYADYYFLEFGNKLIRMGLI